MLWGKDRRKRQRGLTLIEAAMVLGLMAIVMAQVADMMATNAQAIKENATVGRMREVIAAASKYVETNYAMISTDTASGGAYVAGGLAIPMADDVAAPSGLTSVQGGGFLPDSFAPTNAFGQREWLLVKRHPTVPNRLDMMVVTEGGTPVSLARLPGVASKIGAAGGFVSDAAPYAAADVNGAYGGWSSPAAYWTSTGHTPAVGTLAASLAFETTPVADYLYRVAVPGHPEANQMFTDLDMAGGGIRHSITGVQDISTVSVTASGTVSAGDDLAAADDLTVGDDATIGDRLTVNGQSSFGGDSSFGADIAVTGNGTVGGTFGVTGQVTASQGVALAVAGVAVGGACSPNGRVAATSAAESDLLICRSATWQAVSKNQQPDYDSGFLSFASGSVVASHGLGTQNIRVEAQIRDNNTGYIYSYNAGNDEAGSSSWVAANAWFSSTQAGFAYNTYSHRLWFIRPSDNARIQFQPSAQFSVRILAWRL